VTEIQQNRWDRLVRRAANIVGGGSQVNDTLNELFPVIDVETLRAELSLLSGTRLGFGGTSQAALAANNSHSQLFNPVNSGAIITLERIDLSTTIGQLIEYGLATVPLMNFTANHALRDTREGILTQPVGQVRDVQQPGSLPTLGMLFATTDTNVTFEGQRGLFVLAPGTGLTLSTTTVNSTFRVTWLWRERAVEPAELNFP